MQGKSSAMLVVGAHEGEAPEGRDGGAIVELARAKVNLTLEVLGRRGDGYHELQSLVVFADFADVLTFVPGGPLRLEMTGQFAQAVDGQNLVLKAAGVLGALGLSLPEGAFHLDKRIPVAAGLGGGSADAAACMRALLRAGGYWLEEEAGLTPCSGVTAEHLVKLAAGVGADVPVCLFGKAVIMAGVGERLTPVASPPSLPAVLVNPGVKLSTRDVFSELGAPALTEERAAAAKAALSVCQGGGEFSADLDALIEFLAASGNDLEAPAQRLVPVIGEVLGVLRESPGSLLARLSGSGPTCFGLFRSEALAQAAALQIAATRPQWWVRTVMLG